MKNATETIIEMYEAARDGYWEGDETPEDLVRRWANCGRAEIHPNGDIYIADPQDGHYLTDEKCIEFVAWLEANDICV